ncbi:DDE-type integrase/transposase/recombinase [Alicyclobacillus fastidiosus]|uniref:DDE-type integrase/transposase/recombinase n=1 Tax=Alicyclobacillus fastidiosus TaxID=392011 RepID=A0ABY6ZID7_9BACL|nr:DDE-type integrase/transposase/recombinase [Alicyclobacillus fastidiosus]WAH41976.1 DDE-type integrase/transposase/recombinase [Alicyclobacillus fastidiosus]GMA63705.1 transposase [Alicyclobacillus fastidiosus]
MGLDENARKVISRIRESGPSRRVQGGPFNSHGRYPSQKMGFTVQWESGNVERLAVWLYEHDDDVLEYYDQPEKIKLAYVGKDGKKKGLLHTPDFFVLRTQSAGWEEWKTQDRLIQLSEKDPARFTKLNDSWICPPGQDYASQFGLNYSLRSSSEISPTYAGNIHFLSDYLQQPISLDDEKLEELKNLLYRQPGISLSDLLQSPIDIDSDTVYIAIASEKVYVDLSKEPFSEREYIQIFPTKEVAEAFYITNTSPKTIQDDHQIILEVGQKFTWDGATWEVVNVGVTQISFKNDHGDIQTLSISGFESIVKQGNIQGIRTVKSGSAVSEIALEARKENLKIALERYKAIKPFLDGHKKPSSASRNVRRWIKRYNLSLESTGYGLDGLLPQNRRKGNREPRLPESTITKMIEFISDHYEKYQQPTIYTSYILFQKKCNNEGLLCPSYPTYARYVHERPKVTQEKKRKGDKAARKHQEFSIWHLEFSTPRHGERPFEIAHIDHTVLDVEVRLGETGKTARPWLTLMVDAFSRRVLAFDVDFESPSTRSNMRVIRKCVERFQRLPDAFVVDGGKDFESVYFETLAARYNSEIKSRRGKPRNGSVIERIFGTTNKMILYDLIANTQSTKNVRELTPKTNPKNNAVWNLRALDDLLQSWFYETYDTQDHPALGTNPRDMFITGVSLTGQRPQRIVPYDKEFQILTCPETVRKELKVQVGRGVKINYLYYWTDDFRDGRIEGTSVPTRVDPDNAGIAYAYILGRWVELHSEEYLILRGRSRQQVEIATKILRERSKQTMKVRRTINAHQIARLLTEAHDKELQLQIEIDEARNKKNGQIAQDHVTAKITSVSPRLKETHKSSTLTSNSTKPSQEFGNLEDLL